MGGDKARGKAGGGLLPVEDDACNNGDDDRALPEPWTGLVEAGRVSIVTKRSPVHTGLVGGCCVSAATADDGVGLLLRLAFNDKAPGITMPDIGDLFSIDRMSCRRRTLSFCLACINSACEMA